MINSSEIKQIAKNKLSGNLGKAYSITAIFIVINLVISYLSTLIQNITVEIPFIQIVTYIIFILITLPISFGFISSIVKLLKGENPSYTNIINDALLNASKTIGVFFRILLKMLIPSVIVIFICIALFFLITKIASFTISEYLLIIFSLFILAILIIAILSIPYSLSIYALANNNKLSAKEAVNQSIDLMNGNKWNFAKLIISFSGWLILISLIILIFEKHTPDIFKMLIESLGSLLILPYIISSIAVFFDELNDVKIEVVNTNENTENSQNSDNSLEN